MVFQNCYPDSEDPPSSSSATPDLKYATDRQTYKHIYACWDLFYVNKIKRKKSQKLQHWHVF